MHNSIADLEVIIEAYGVVEPPPISRTWLSECRVRADALDEPHKTDVYTLIAHLERLLP